MDPPPSVPLSQSSPFQGGPPPTLPIDSQPRTGAAKGMSLLIALLINGTIFMVLAWWTISHLKEEQVELVVAAGKKSLTSTVSKKEFQQRQKSKPQPASGSKAPPVIASAAANSATFVMPSEDTPEIFGIGDGFGAGSGFGSGSGAGGSVGFFGSRSAAKRVCFIIDVSASLSNEQFTLIKSELTKSLVKLAPTVQYQVIFFSGPAWFAEDEEVGGRGGGARGTRKIKHGGKTYEWKSKGGASQFYLVDEKKLYTAKWLDAKKSAINKTLKRIEEVRKSYGTDWRHPLTMALSMDPKPDVVYFLTDGAVSNGQQAVDMVLKLNNRGKPKAKINTIVMMQPRAEDLLGELAKRTDGEFTVVKADGSVVRPGKDDKKKGKN